MLANHKVKDPDAPNKVVLNYADAIARDKDYEVSETKTSFVKDIILYGAIWIGSVVVLVTLVYSIVICYKSRK